MIALAPEVLALAWRAAPHGLLVIDAAGAIEAANPALEAMFGLAPGSAPGQPVTALLPPDLQDGAPGVDLLDAAGGPPQLLRGRHQRGHVVSVELGLSPLHPAGRPGRMLAWLVDRSERLVQQQALRGLFDASPYGKLIVDDDGHIHLANRVLAQSLGHTPAALVGQPLSALLPERYRAHHARLMAGYQATGEARMMGRGRDLTALHADGTELPVEIGLSRLQWQGRPMTLAAISDISMRKQLELALRQANADLEEFSYVASHDLRSPLRGIADLVEWIGEDLGPGVPAPVQRNLARIRQRIRRMDQLMDDLLSYARAGRAATDFSSVDLAVLVRGILEMQPLPAGMQVRLALDVAPFPALRVPLETALRNLLANAGKHHDRADGRVLVQARHEGSHCLIEVIDDGPGVPAAAQARIFKLFQTASTADRGGSGIGLALTKRLVDLHGGRLQLVSPWPPGGAGRGACFRVAWPRFARRTTDE